MLKLGSLLAAAFAATISAIAVAQEAPTLLQRMAGTWDVQQRMRPGPDAATIDLPSAIARRELIGGKYLEENMQPANGEATQSAFFHRNAFLNYNSVTKRYEYTSLDTRAPQLMMEVSVPADPQRVPAAELKLKGGVFLAPEWGNAKNVPFRYRLSIGEIENDRQTIRLYLTPQAVLPRKEFLAFEYVYTRRP
jgi:hypothetical protein